MAELLVDSAIVLGRIIPVKNTKKKIFSNAKTTYYAVQVEDYNGDNEECLLFTEKELEKARYRATRNPEDLPTKSWWVDLTD